MAAESYDISFKIREVNSNVTYLEIEVVPPVSETTLKKLFSVAESSLRGQCSVLSMPTIAENSLSSFGVAQIINPASGHAEVKTEKQSFINDIKYSLSPTGMVDTNIVACDIKLLEGQIA
ncbi:MAG: hypothetical protein JWO47_678 [Candidatus Saccharibacteria bacterium]|nr:hypothetical protein [Candidatus Saccharibacteria bacterium]